MLKSRMGNTFCAYETPKVAKIQSKTLGCFNNSLCLAIVLYVGLIEVWRNGGYLASQPVQGTARYTLQEPTRSGCDPLTPGCRLNLTAVNKLPYCDQYEDAATKPYNGTRFPCTFWDAQAASQTYDTSVVLTTRVTQYAQELVCNATAAEACPFIYNITGEETYYVADVEDYTLLIDHTVQADAFGLYGTARNLHSGLVQSLSASLCAETGRNATDARGRPTMNAPCFVQPHKTSTNLDFISVKDLLLAADVTLDDISYGGETYRETGVNVMLTIAYTNFEPWRGLTGISYIYKPKVLPATSYKYYEPEYLRYRAERVLLDQHGIRIVAIHSGDLYQRDYQQLIITITTALTFFAIAAFIVDKLMLYCLPNRKQYEECKYEYSVDFEDWEQLKLGRKMRGEQQPNRQQSEGGQPLLPQNDDEYVPPRSSYGGLP